MECRVDWGQLQGMQNRDSLQHLGQASVAECPGEQARTYLQPVSLCSQCLALEGNT